MSTFIEESKQRQERPSLEALYPDIGQAAMNRYESAQQTVDTIGKITSKEKLVELAESKTTQLLMAKAKLRGNQTVQVPVFVLGELAQIVQAFTSFFNVLAPKGILCHIDSSQYTQLRLTVGKAQAMQAIKRVTAHNGKLGWNWIKEEYQSVLIKNPNPTQYSTGAYPQYLRDAAAFWADTALGQYYALMAKPERFSKAPTLQPQLQLRSATEYTMPSAVKGMDLSEAENMCRAHGLFDDKISTNDLRQLLEQAQLRTMKGLDDIMVNCHMKYIKSLIDPFAKDTPGVRIPTVNPVDTFTHTQYESFTIQPGTMQKGGKILIIFNPTAIRPRPVLLFDDSAGRYNALSSQPPIIKQVRQFAPGYIDQAAKTLAVWETGPIADNIDKWWTSLQTPVPAIFTQLDQRYTGKIRLVSAGIRIYKTSQAITESGTMRAAYKPRGGLPQTSLDRALETGPTSKYNIKIFPSQSARMGDKAGFLLQSNYRPHADSDTDRWYSATQDFACEEYLPPPMFDMAYPQAEEDKFGGDGPEIEDARSRFIGPMSFYGKRTVDPTWDYLNSVRDTSVDPAWLQAGVRFAMNAADFGRPHTTLISLDQTDGIAFEVEVVRHFEVVPGEESPLETKSCALAVNYTSPLDLIRKFQVEQLEVNPFAPSAMTPMGSVWDMSMMLLPGTEITKWMSSLNQDSEPARVKGLFQNLFKWLARHVAAPGLQWLGQKAQDWGAKGIRSADEDDEDIIEDVYEMAGNDSRTADIEKNPGPGVIVSLLNLSNSHLNGDESQDDVEG